MFDTEITIVGNCLTTPEWRRTASTAKLVATFKVASTARHRDRNTQQWVDGKSLRLRVSCWERLAEGVTASIMVGDPVIVVGRLYTRDWVDENGNRRVLYELDASTVGHDLSRGQARFTRTRMALATSEIDDGEAERRVGGEPTVPVVSATGDPEDPFEDEDDEEETLESLASMRRVGFDAELVGTESDEDDESDDSDEEGEAGKSAKALFREPVAA